MGGVLISMIGCGRREGTRKCLEKALATAPNAEFVLTDNASKDGTGDMFQHVTEASRHRQNIHLFRETENTGFIPPGNRAFHLSVTRGREFTILLNDDTDPPEGWLEKLLEPFKDPAVALTCPHGTCCSLDDAFNGYDGQSFEYCEGSCLAIRNSAILSFSPTLFDENLSGIYGDDSNLSLRAREKGWKIARADFHMPHIRSATTRSPEVSAFCDFHKKKNHDYNVQRWKYYLQARHMDFPIVLSRSYALGDILLTTPILRAISKSNPLSPLFVLTATPELFDRNPCVSGAYKDMTQLPHDAVIINLDGAYESRNMTHIVEAYEAEVRQHLPGLGKVELKTELYPSKADFEWAEDYLKSQQRSDYGNRPLALISSEPTTWRGKNYPLDRFTEIRTRLANEGWLTRTVGTRTAELTTTLHQLAALTSMAKLFVGNDSFPMHVAQAMGCPTVGIFGPTLPRFIFTQGSKAAAAAASPSIPCAGQRHRVAGKTFVDCNGDCINSVTVEDVWAAITKLGVL